MITALQPTCAMKLLDTSRKIVSDDCYVYVGTGLGYNTGVFRGSLVSVSYKDIIITLLKSIDWSIK